MSIELRHGNHFSQLHYSTPLGWAGGSPGQPLGGTSACASGPQLAQGSCLLCGCHKQPLEHTEKVPAPEVVWGSTCIASRWTAERAVAGSSHCSCRPSCGWTAACTAQGTQTHTGTGSQNGQFPAALSPPPSDHNPTDTLEDRMGLSPQVTASNIV